MEIQGLIIHFLSSINFDNSKLACLPLGFNVEPKETCLLKPSPSVSSISSEVSRDEQSALATASSSSSFPEKGPVMAKKSLLKK